MCLGYRENDLNLADHLGDHKRALQLVEVRGRGRGRVRVRVRARVRARVRVRA